MTQLQSEKIKQLLPLLMCSANTTINSTLFAQLILQIFMDFIFHSILNKLYLLMYLIEGHINIKKKKKTHPNIDKKIYIFIIIILLLSIHEFCKKKKCFCKYVFIALKYGFDLMVKSIHVFILLLL